MIAVQVRDEHGGDLARVEPEVLQGGERGGAAVEQHRAAAAAITSVIQEGVALHAAVISLDLSIGEHFLTPAETAQMNAALERAREQHVTVVDGSGDDGARPLRPAG